MTRIAASLTFVAMLVLAVGAVAQTPAPAANGPQGNMSSKPEGGMMPDCQAMMAKKQEMQAKLQAMDATLDKLVAEMNAAAAANRADAMEKPMAAVINELVTQRKAAAAMREQMESAMMAHMMGHLEMAGTKDGMKHISDCPMMKMGGSLEPEKPHQM